MRFPIWSVLVWVFLGFCSPTQACINDSKTLSAEKRQHPSLAQAILSPKIEQPDVKSLTEDIQKLNSNPKTNDPAWWNDLAGAYLRLSRPTEAVKILEPLTNRFANDYGIHANLGTAYHLLGRYADAEKEIRRDTEINPDAHFGLEKYHLALLQYLSRDQEYRLWHVYVDEFTSSFLSPPQLFMVFKSARASFFESQPDESTRKKMQAEKEISRKTFSDAFQKIASGEANLNLSEAVLGDEPPEYMENWDLVAGPKLDEGVIYMATLNPKEPACWVMLGLIAARHRDLNLAKAAFKEAIELGSPQAPILQRYLIYFGKFHPP
ncbi:MAG TPA: tetratricopeptide repeat protein, partial [Verrucomicrobiae bacterium]|nr:tetratricopeptide repeat protein [Verrucomicrobiae bacterium]